MNAAEQQPFDVDSVRADFPILSSSLDGAAPLIYLNNAATSQHPRQVIDCVREAYETYYGNVHRGLQGFSAEITERFENARCVVRDFIHARETREIIFTSGTTASINLVARSWGDANVKSGDEILLTEMEHHSNIVPWQQLAQRTGCKVRFLPITDEGLLDLGALSTCLTERTKMVSVVGVSNVLGTINPVKEIIDHAHRSGALVLVDAAQSVPHEPADVQALDADFLAFSGHKMLGPSGVGVLWGREELLERMPPFLGGGSMIHRVTLDGFEPAPLPSKFEAGTPPIVPVLGLAAGMEYLRTIGMETICRCERELVDRAFDVLGQFDGLRILGPSPEARSGIVSFAVEGVAPFDIATMLSEQGLEVREGHHCAMPLHARLGLSASTRASFYFYNTPEEVDKLGEALGIALRILRRER